MKLKIFFLSVLISLMLNAQVGSININVFDDFTKKPIEAKIGIKGSEKVYEGQGNILIPELPSGLYTFEVSSPNHESAFINDITIVPNQNLTYSIGLSQASTNI